MLIGHSPAMLQLIKVVTKVAKTDANILITGENGTGKEMLARKYIAYLHETPVSYLVSIWGLSANRSLRVNSSDTNVERLLMLMKAVRVNSKPPMVVRFYG